MPLEQAHCEYVCVCVRCLAPSKQAYCKRFVCCLGAIEAGSLQVSLFDVISFCVCVFWV